MGDFLTWLAPIVSTLIICAGQLMLNARFKRADEKRDRARAETKQKLELEQEWRNTLSSRIDIQEQKINTIMQAQCSQMRSDVIHKCHRYLDDMGCASTEEKQSLHAEYDDYQKLCDISHIGCILHQQQLCLI